MEKAACRNFHILTDENKKPPKIELYKRIVLVGYLFYRIKLPLNSLLEDTNHVNGLIEM